MFRIFFPVSYVNPYIQIPSTRNCSARIFVWLELFLTKITFQLLSTRISERPPGANSMFQLKISWNRPCFCYTFKVRQSAPAVNNLTDLTKDNISLYISCRATKTTHKDATKSHCLVEKVIPRAYTRCWPKNRPTMLLIFYVSILYCVINLYTYEFPQCTDNPEGGISFDDRADY